MTAKDLINGALQLIRVLSAGRSANTFEYASCLSSLNDLLGSWSAEQLPVFELKRETLPLTGAACYTIGAGGTLATVRPVAIRAAVVEAANGASAPAKLASAEEWAGILDPAETGTFAELIHIDNGYPQITVRLWPRPATGSLVLYSIKPLASVADLDTVLALPSGYEMALRYNLAVAVAPEFRDAQLSAEVAAIASSSKAAIAATNAQMLQVPTPVAAAPVEVTQ